MSVLSIYAMTYWASIITIVTLIYNAIRNIYILKFAFHTFHLETSRNHQTILTYKYTTTQKDN